MKCFGDYHTHSEYSHGRGDLRKNIASAISKGLKEYAVTDHGPLAWNFVRLGVKDAGELLEIKKKLYSLQLEYPEINLYAGVEANIINRDGDIDVPENILAELDIIALGFHLLIFPVDFRSAKDIIINNRIIYKCFSGRRNDIRRHNTEVLMNAVRKYDIDFITHPGYGVDIDTYELAAVCAEEDTCLEINARHGELTEGFVRAASETGVRFIINSDAHSPEQVGELGKGLKIVEKLGLSRERILNVE